MVIVIPMAGRIHFYHDSKFYIMTPLGWECRICQDSVRRLSFHLLKYHGDKIRGVIKRKK